MILSSAKLMCWRGFLGIFYELCDRRLTFEERFSKEDPQGFLRASCMACGLCSSFVWIESYLESLERVEMVDTPPTKWRYLEVGLRFKLSLCLKEP